jgi:signal recognition particle subunit SRP54
MRKLGPMQKILSMLPGMGAMREMLDKVDAEKDMTQLFGIIDSMTPDERRNPSKVVDQSRRRRIAAGAGVEPHQVNDLVKQFDTMADMMKKMSSMGPIEKFREMQKMQAGMMGSGGMPSQKGNTGKRLTPKEKAKLKKEREREARRKKRGGRSDGGDKD